ncbi:MAG TPA: efflux RND transporter periplasmic adaptor subunit [Kofleriaceae bacterium]|nr:efflux RND transporter periplasmic adaptor subunit [Kofleriaceae bacterium]
MFLVSWWLTSACGTEGAAPAPRGGATPRQVTAERGALRERILLTGKLEAERSENLTVPMTRLWQLSVRWLAEDGAEVKKGDKVVEFDNAQFVSEVDQKELGLLQAEIDYSSQRAIAARSVSDKEHAVARQTLVVERARLLAGVARDLMTERDWQERQLELERQNVALATAQRELAAEKKATALDLEVKRIAADKIRRDLETTKEGIQRLTLSAPKDGILLIGEHPWEDRKLQVGDVMQPGWTAAELPELGAIVVDARLSDVDDGRLAAGARARCTLDAYPETAWEGTVREVAPVAQEMGEGLRRAFRVKIALDRTDRDRMRPGMSVRVEVLGPEVANALLVPRAALALGGEKPAARLASGALQPVTLGACDAHRCVVTEGLSEGQELLAGDG